MEFSECRQEHEPEEYEIDVKRTDSILNPYMGTITISIELSCTVRKAVPPGTFLWTEKKMNRMAAACSGKTYEECIENKAANSLKKKGPGIFLCTDTGDRVISYEGKIILTYRWSEGKWEFEREDAEPPLPLQEEPVGIADSRTMCEWKKAG